MKEGLELKIMFFGTKPYDRMWFEPLSKRYDVEIIYTESQLNASTAPMAKGVEAVCIFVNDRLDAQTADILYGNGVRLVLLRCAGYNNVDLDACRNKLTVLRVPNYSPRGVAEYAAGLLMTVNRHIHKAYVRTREFNMSINGLMGFDLAGKTAGVIGTGKIGQSMIDILLGFKMKVLAYDTYPIPREDVHFVSLDRLFSESDVITLHCPLNRDTRHIIDENAVKKMKTGVFIINTSRGGLIKTSALLDGLKEGKIGGVGLDVYEEEEGIFYEDNSDRIVDDDCLARLMMFPNVIITSHQGYFTFEGMQSIAETTLENAEMFMHGKQLINRI